MMKKMIMPILIGLSFLSCKKEDNSIKGCTDSNADNYNALATVNEGCAYPAHYILLGNYIGKINVYSDDNFSNKVGESNISFDLTAENKKYYLDDGSGNRFTLYDFYVLNNNYQIAMNTLNTIIGDNLYRAFERYTAGGSDKYSGSYEHHTKKLKLYFEVIQQSSGNKGYVEIDISKQ